MKRPLTIGATALALVLPSCGGGNDKKPSTSPASSNTAEPDETAPPPNTDAQLPPAFVKCMADQGYELESADEIHSAPMQALQTCFPALHGGGTP
jgi:hypothetical protein